eukprot:NODE_57_length_25931_cov_0.351037.p17 type:complete len:114 gc:universal NODE_57_length_25931_cov_0.351037:7384-7043(-)
MKAGRTSFTSMSPSFIPTFSTDLDKSVLNRLFTGIWLASCMSLDPLWPENLPATLDSSNSELIRSISGKMHPSLDITMKYVWTRKTEQNYLKIVGVSSIVCITLRYTLFTKPL